MDVLATGSLFVWGHVVTKAHIPHYLSKAPTAPPDVAYIDYSLEKTLADLCMPSNRGPGLISFPLDRSKGPIEPARMMVPQLLFYTMCQWMGRKKGFVTINAVWDVQPERLDRLRDIWGAGRAAAVVSHRQAQVVSR